MCFCFSMHVLVFVLKNLNEAHRKEENKNKYTFVGFHETNVLLFPLILDFLAGLQFRVRLIRIKPSRKNRIGPPRNTDVDPTLEVKLGYGSDEIIFALTLYLLI